ncbi:MAG: helix-turn-helix domain-containing protein [Pseudonocardiaceae bacterium]
MTDDPLPPHFEAFGSFLRAQRELANLSLREMARRTNVSNAYLSQIERGLHAPSVRVLRSIARALDLSTKVMLAQAGLFEQDPTTGEGTDEPPGTEAAIRNDPHLTGDQKGALLRVYRSFLDANRRA